MQKIMKEKLQKFNNFCAKIDLKRYREKYSKIKLVELDLPKNIQAIKPIYKYYWEDFNLLNYENFYSLYSKSIAEELEDFRKKTMFSEETFYRGLPARIYRTWASLLTQIQGGYVAGSLYPKIEMSAELDYKGIDMKIFTDLESQEYINIQIKKETMSREVRTPWVGLKNKQQITNIVYEVTYASPLTKTGKECKPYKDWQEKWSNKLQKLENGFIIFLPKMFSLDNIKTP